MSGRGAAKVARCKRCQIEGPWIYNDEGQAVGKHDCAEVEASPAVERDAAIEATSAANEGSLKAALAIIREAALAHERFSSNQVRGRMNIAQVPGPTVGAAFRQAAKNGWIRGDGYEQSTDVGTHGHPVRVWSSLIWRSRSVAS